MGMPENWLSHRCFENILESLPIGVALHTLDNEEAGYANRLFREIYGEWVQGQYIDLDTFLGQVCGQPGQIERIRRRLEGIVQEESDPSHWDDMRIPGRDGSEKIVSVRCIPLPDLKILVSTVQDVTEQKLAEQSLRESERRYHMMAEASPVGIFRLGPEGSYRHVNKAWREISGLTESQVLGREWDLAVHPEDRVEARALWQAAVGQGRSFRGECRLKKPEGGSVWVLIQADPILDSQDQLEGYIGSVTDISQRKRSEEEIRQIAYYDPLTHLPNRTFFLEQLERAMATARRNESLVALLFCDLDNFKDVNDTLGHDKGDLLLQQIAGRLNSCIRRGDTLCRLGGDEFVLLLPTIGKDSEAAIVARKIQRSLLPAFDLGGHQVYSRASIGIAVYPEDGPDVQTLLKHADTAMYAAKGAGRNRYRFFSEEMNRRSRNRLKIETGLRQAISGDELSLAWQPQYDLQTRALIGVEALLRWRNPLLGKVPPAAFIPVAEESGLIHEIGAWVLRTACTQMQIWRGEGAPDLRVAVNLSASQFREPGISTLVRGILQETGLDPRLLELEITESVLMGDADTALTTLQALRNYGVHLAIDDFGTGYSSLLYLKKFPVGRIKIARDFIRDILTDPNDAAIAGTVINMARSLSMRAIAEGVESQEQAELLRSMSCPEVQGFFFSPPLKAAEFQSQILGGRSKTSREAEG
jgi:diguanylate cyclase (GGDEF)-like protein/PAS domain S-box-containing protein